MPVEPVERAPRQRDKGIDHGGCRIERQLRNLSGRQLTKGVSELNDALVVLVVVAEGANAIVARSLYWVVDCGWIAKMNCFGDNLRPRDLCCVFGENEGAELVLFARSGTYCCLIADK